MAAEGDPAILERIAGPGREPIPGRTVVVLAHPDDETLACGALLPRLADVTLVHVTDGAPRDAADAIRHGFETWRDYAAARRLELEEAAAIAGIGPDRLVSLGIPDQGAAVSLPQIARSLTQSIAGADLVLTHAFEGGHPDHDAVAFAVHAAASLLGPAAPRCIVEMPLYRLGPGNEWCRQSFFEADSHRGAVLPLNAGERVMKARMIAAHHSQRDTLAGFGAADEPYRVAPAYDFTASPNGGAVLYEQYGWGMTSRAFAQQVRAAQKQLRLGTPSS